MTAHITKFIAENEDGYFTANLDNGSARIGLRGCECFDFPASHEDYSRVVLLTENEIEDAHDEFMGKYVCA